MWDWDGTTNNSDPALNTCYMYVPSFPSTFILQLFCNCSLEHHSCARPCGHHQEPHWRTGQHRLPFWGHYQWWHCHHSLAPPAFAFHRSLSSIIDCTSLTLSLPLPVFFFFSLFCLSIGRKEKRINRCEDWVWEKFFRQFVRSLWKVGYIKSRGETKIIFLEILFLLTGIWEI